MIFYRWTPSSAVWACLLTSIETTHTHGWYQRRRRNERLFFRTPKRHSNFGTSFFFQLRTNCSSSALYHSVHVTFCSFPSTIMEQLLSGRPDWQHGMWLWKLMNDIRGFTWFFGFSAACSWRLRHATIHKSFCKRHLTTRTALMLTFHITYDIEGCRHLSSRYICWRVRVSTDDDHRPTGWTVAHVWTTKLKFTAIKTLCQQHRMEDVSQILYSFYWYCHHH